MSLESTTGLYGKEDEKAVRSSTETSTRTVQARKENGAPVKPVKENKKRQRSIFVRFLNAMKAILLGSYLNVLLVFIPIGLALGKIKMNKNQDTSAAPNNIASSDSLGGPPQQQGVAPAAAVFSTNCLAIIPLAVLLGRATKAMAASWSPVAGALMNATFGNAVELIILIIALVKGEIRIVQASLLGSILANLLLILGMCFLLGGLRYREQIYNPAVTQTMAVLLSLSMTSLVLPSAFHASFRDNQLADGEDLIISRITSIVLLVLYLLYLVFQLKTHAYMYRALPQDLVDEESQPGPVAAMLHEPPDQDRGANDVFCGGSGDDQTETSVAVSERVLHHFTGYRRQFSTTSKTSATVIAIDSLKNTTGDDPKYGSPTPLARIGIRRTNSLPDRLSQCRHYQSCCHRRPSSLTRHIATTHQISPSSPRPQPMVVAITAMTSTPATLQPPMQISSPPTTTAPSLSPVTSTVLLLLTTALVALHAETMIDSIPTLTSSSTSGISPTSIGLVLIPIVSTAASHAAAAVSDALRNKMDLAIGVAVGSSIQTALLVTPLMVVVGWCIGDAKDREAMTLRFTLFETACLALATLIAGFLMLDGRSNYLEGALLVAAWAIVVVAAVYYPEGGGEVGGDGGVVASGGDGAAAGAGAVIAAVTATGGFGR